MNPEHVAQRDRWLEGLVSDRLAHDTRLAGADVDVRLDGGVAHVEGRVPDERVRQRLRETVCSLRGVCALWDGIVVGDRPPLRTLDIGCGRTKQRTTSYGVDVHLSPSVDVVADITAPLPFADRSVDRVYAVHVLEHLLDVVAVMNELHRVLGDDGVLHVLSPHWRAPAALADPTHVKYLDVQTFKWFCTPRCGASTWHPLHAAGDGENVFADLQPLRDGNAPDGLQLALFFD